MIDQDQLRTSILRKLREWVEVMPDPDKPFVGFAGGRGTLSPQQIVEEVENGTRLGQRFVQNWVQLAVNHIIESSLVRPAPASADTVIATKKVTRSKPLRLGDIAPDFTAETTQGLIHFHEWIGNSWVCLFSNPRDFVPVGTTELGYISKIKPEFDKRNVKIIGLSIDPSDSHRRWLEDIRETQGTAVNFPIIADPDRKVAELYGMIDSDACDVFTVRSVFIIGPDKKIKLMITYPAGTGHNFDEILRVLDSLQLTARYSVATPVNWKNGEDVVIVPSVSDTDARAKFPAGWKAPKPYLRITPQPNKKTSTDAKAKESSGQ